jgi:galactose mutarotase-like enzyme
MMHWTPIPYEGCSAWQGETNSLRIILIPSLGSKIISFVDKRTSKEWLWRSGKPLGSPGYGAAYADGDGSGWDEMFPSVNECRYPHSPWSDRNVPDHGEVWSLPWSDQLNGSCLTCSVEGVRFPYSLTKTCSFPDDRTFRMDYTVTNRSEFAFSCLWAAHPLLRVTDGMILELGGNPHPREIVISYSHAERLGSFGNKVSWPVVTTAQDRINLAVYDASGAVFAEKYYFSPPIRTSEASLFDPFTGERFTLRYDAAKTPYLAVWSNGRGFGGHRHLAIEPASGMLDDVNYAAGSNQTAIVPPYGQISWHLEASV